VPNQASLTGPAAEAIAPDLLAMFAGAQPHPDIETPQRFVTVADLVAAARSVYGDRDRPVMLRWDGPRQQLSL
jgi:hypothetical protein